MLPRRSRLVRAAFSNTGKEMRATSPHFSVSVRENATGIAAVVSKKIERTSVGRHRLKRRMLSVLAAWCGVNRGVIVYARAGSNTLPYAALQEELGELLTRLLGIPPVR